MYIISEIRRETPPIPAAPRRKRFFFLVFLLIGVGLLNVWLSGQYVLTGYRVSSILEEKRILQMQKDVLSAEALMLSSPSRIDAIARNQLGMVDPQEGVMQ